MAMVTANLIQVMMERNGVMSRSLLPVVIWALPLQCPKKIGHMKHVVCIFPIRSINPNYNTIINTVIIFLFLFFIILDDVITDVHHEIGKTDPALRKKIPDKTFYISFDVRGKENPHYDHPQYYPYETSSRPAQPQIDHVSFKVFSIKSMIH